MLCFVTYLMPCLVDADETLRSSGVDFVSNEARVLVTTVLTVANYVALSSSSDSGSHFQNKAKSVRIVNEQQR
jgi:hypothetical protein